MLAVTSLLLLLLIMMMTVMMMMMMMMEVVLVVVEVPWTMTDHAALVPVNPAAHVTRNVDC